MEHKSKIPMAKISPLVLCGGVGTRLWPLSRALQPKQFQPIHGEVSTTFFQATVQRHRAGLFTDPIVSVAADHVQTAKRQLREIQCQANIIAEPIARNTGPAVLTASLVAYAANPDSLMLVLPSDHVIKGDLNSRIASALPAAMDGAIVVFGIAPRYAETGYGYILDGGAHEGYSTIHRVAQFVEKPDKLVASALVESGTAFWASGISLFRSQTLIDEYRRFDPETFSAVHASIERGAMEGNVLALDKVAFEGATSLPTESSVFEKSDRVVLAPAAIDWDDVGGWAAYHAIGLKTDEGNVTSGDVIMVDTNDSFVRSGDRLVAVVGMTDVVVIDTHDALLVTNRQNSQKVKTVVERLVTMKRAEVVDHSKRATDWGYTSLLAKGLGYGLELLSIQPGATLRFEPLADRRRLLTLALGKATLEIAGTRSILLPGRSIELQAGEEGVLDCSLDSMVQLVQVTCDVLPASEQLRQAIELTSLNGSREYV